MAAHKRSTAGSDSEQDVRQQEVLRANRELAAYFKGRRTEREARAALKIIKAFIRDREDLDPSARRPLPGASQTARTAAKERPRKRANGSSPRRRVSGRPRRSSKETVDRAPQVPAENPDPGAEIDTGTSD